MQAIFQQVRYTGNMTGIGTHLRSLREQAGISLRELSRQIDVHPSNVSFWENNDKLPSSGVLLKMAHALGVQVEELLGGDPRQNGVVRGRMAKLFVKASDLPKSKQDRIHMMIEDMLIAHEAKAQ